MRARGTSLIGRESQLARLDAVVDAVVAGTSAFVLLIGEAGIGKTRLLGAAAEAAERRGLRVLSGTSMESGAALPYLPLLAPLGTCVAPPAGGPAVERVRRALGHEGAGAGRRTGAEQEDAALLVASIYDVLIARPTVLLIDDVQWADRSTLAVLDYLSHRGADAAIGIVAAGRDDEPERLRQLPIADGRRFTQVPIEGLSRAQVGAQVAEILETGTSAADLDEIYRRTSGNPFFVEQLVADWAAGSQRTSSAPPQLQALVLARVARLTAPARAAVEALAVLEHPASEILAGEVAGLTADSIVAPLREAVAGGVVRAGPVGFEMRHPVFGEAVRAELPGTVRVELHRRAAVALAALDGDRGQIAEHWWQAGDRQRAWRSAIDAGQAAIRTLGFPEARLHLERALELWPDGEPGRSIIELAAGDAAWLAGDALQALEHARLAEAHLDQPNDGSEAAKALHLEVLLAQGAAAWDAGSRGDAIRAFDRIGTLIPAGLPPRQLSRAMWGLGRARVGEGKFDESHDLAMAAAVLARATEDRGQEAEDYMLAGMSRAFQGSGEAVALLSRARDLAVEAGSPSKVGHSFQFLVDLLGLTGDVDGALATALDGIPLAERLGLARSLAADLRGMAALLLLDLGRPAEADALIGSAEPRSVVELARARLAIRAANRSAAGSALARAAAAAAIGGPGSNGPWTTLTGVELGFLFGDRSAALEALGRLERGPGIWGVDVAAWQALWAARLDSPTDNGPDDAVWATVGAHPDPALARAMTAEIVARSGAPGGEPSGGGPSDTGSAAWRAATDAWLAADRPHEAGLTLLAAAEASLAARDRRAARDALREASDLAGRIGAKRLGALVEDLARRSRIATTTNPRRQPDPIELTRRERDVLGLLADGMTNIQIAERLFLSRGTIGIHVSRILGKLDAHTRGEAVAVARRRGLVIEPVARP
jgi:DNA-binding CsgD family transcriptional regulator/tetratricopeptide (TPR) repeat protein